jgi:type I restriction enzyme S subunit
MKDHASGSTVLHLQTRAVPNLTFDIPTSKPEQAKIAEILSTVDRAIAQTEALIAKQQRIKAGLMHDLLTRGIDEHGTLRSEETHAFKDSPLGRIPAEWGVKRLDAIIDIIDCKHYTPRYVADGIPVIRPRNIKDYGFDLSDLDYVTEMDYALLTDKHEPGEGDIVFSRNASFGVPVYVSEMGKFCIGQDVVIMRKRIADTKYLYFALKSEQVGNQIALASGGSTFGRIDLAAIRTLQIAHPKEETEQITIANKLDRYVQSIKQLRLQRDKYHLVKTALMQDLLTGTRRVTALLEPEEASV